MNKLNQAKLLLVVSICLTISGAVSAQTANIIVQTGEVKLADSTVVGFGDVSAFFAVTSDSISSLNSLFDPLVIGAKSGNLQPLIDSLTGITWTPLAQATELGAGYEWATSFLAPAPLGVGQRILIGFTTSSGFDSISGGDQIGIAASVYSPTSTFDSFTTGLLDPVLWASADHAEAIIGTAGSLQLTAVPEPSAFALLFGVFGLGLVMWRRRK